MKGEFAIENITNLSDIKKGGWVHILGICGSAMGNLAIMLKGMGFKVTGSDKAFNPPMSEALYKNQIEAFCGYDGANITKDIDLVVIGNSVMRTNPEVQKIQELEIPYTIFPSILQEVIVSQDKSVVVTGTHGKTTTTSLVVQILRLAGLDPSFFVGGICDTLQTGLYRGKSDISVIEGDEYDTCFFVKSPKFFFYRPTVLVVQSIEFDHADIYGDIHEIALNFRKVCEMVPNSGFIIVNRWGIKDYLYDFINFDSLECNVLKVGEDLQCDIVLKGRKQYRDRQEILCSFKGEELVFSTPLFGQHNAYNLLSALLVANTVTGINLSDLCLYAPNLSIVRKRWERKLDSERLTVVEDFAHHPTAVKNMLRSLKEVYRERDVVIVLDPQSNTSRRDIFRTDYERALAEADAVIIIKPIRKEGYDTDISYLKVDQIKEELERRSVMAEIADNYLRARELLVGMVSTILNCNRDIVVGVFSNRGKVIDDTLLDQLRIYL